MNQCRVGASCGPWWRAGAAWPGPCDRSMAGPPSLPWTDTGQRQVTGKALRSLLWDPGTKPLFSRNQHRGPTANTSQILLCKREQINTPIPLFLHCAFSDHFGVRMFIYFIFNEPCGKDGKLALNLTIYSGLVHSECIRVSATVYLMQ